MPSLEASPQLLLLRLPETAAVSRHNMLLSSGLADTEVTSCRNRGWRYGFKLMSWCLSNEKVPFRGLRHKIFSQYFENDGVVQRVVLKVPSPTTD